MIISDHAVQLSLKLVCGKNLEKLGKASSTKWNAIVSEIHERYRQ